MLAPLRTMTVTSSFGVKAVPPSGLPDSNGVKRHIGTDLRAFLGTAVYAPEAGVISVVSTHPTSGNKTIELKGKYWHRFLHLSGFDVKVGDVVKAGRLLGWTGNSGGVKAHLHWDVRRPGTAWNASLSNYYDPMKLIKGDDMSKVTLTTARIMAFAIGGRNGYDGTKNALAGQSDEDLKKNHVGKDLEANLITWYNSTEGKNWREKRLSAAYKNDGTAATPEQIIGGKIVAEIKKIK